MILCLPPSRKLRPCYGVCGYCRRQVTRSLFPTPKIRFDRVWPWHTGNSESPHWDSHTSTLSRQPCRGGEVLILAVRLEKAKCGHCQCPSSPTDCRSGCIRSAPTELPCRFGAIGLIRVDAANTTVYSYISDIYRGPLALPLGLVVFSFPLFPVHRSRNLFFWADTHSLPVTPFFCVTRALYCLLRYPTAALYYTKSWLSSSVGTSRAFLRRQRAVPTRRAPPHTPSIPVDEHGLERPHQQRLPSKICLFFAAALPILSNCFTHRGYLTRG